MKFYTYLHTRNDTGTVFYVGKGQGDRAYEYGRNLYWNRIADKHGYSVIILDKFELEEDAHSLERYLIASYLALGFKLINLTAGGEGVSGLRHTVETKQRLKELATGNKNNLGRSPSAEVRAKIKAKLSNPPEEFRKRLSDAHKGKKLSLDHRDKIRKSNLGRVTSEETLIKLRKPKSKEHCMNISTGRAGIIFTEEHRKSLSRALKAYFENKKVSV